MVMPADGPLEVAGLGAVEDHAGQPGADRLAGGCSALVDQRPLLAAGDGQDDRVGGTAQTGLASMLPRIGPVSIRMMSKCFSASSTSRRTAAGESVPA